MERYLKVTVLLAMISKIQATIDGKSYMDPLDTRPLDKKLPGEDPCNPLYWYPRHVPEYCYYKPTMKPNTKPPLPVPIPVPIPVPPPAPIPIPIPPPVPIPIPVPPPAPIPIPIPPPVPIPIPVPPPMPIPLPIPPPVPIPVPGPPPPLPIPLPQPMPIPLPGPIPSIPMPYPIYHVPPPLIPSPYMPMYPIPNVPYGYPPQAGMVPGLPGMVSRNGGINILPFSDVYSDMLEKHKNKMIRRKLATILREYEDFPNRKSYRRLKKFRKIF